MKKLLTYGFSLTLSLFLMAGCSGSDSKKDTSTTNNTGTTIPEINVKQATTTLSSGYGAYNFGQVNLGSSSSAVTFTIENLGTGSLTLSNPSMTSGHTSDFAISTSGISNTIAAAGSTTFTVTFTPGARGSRSAVLTITDNDSDEGTYTITVKGTTAIVSTIAGSGTATSTDGTGTAASFNTPWGITLDTSGNLIVSDYYGHKIRMITTSTVVTTYAGNGIQFNTNGASTSTSSFQRPNGVVFDSSGNLFIAENHMIRKITPAGVVSTLAGNFNSTSTDGTGTLASFNFPYSIAIDSSDNLYVGENYKVRKVTPAGVVTTFAGTGAYGNADGATSTATFSQTIMGVAVDASNNVFVVDSSNHKIRKITQAGVVSTFVGSATSSSGYADGTGTAALFTSPQGIAIDSGGNFYVTDFGNGGCIRKVTPAGVVTTIAGSGTPGSIDGPGNSASFNSSVGLVVDALGNIYVADSGSHKIRKIVP